MVADFGSRSILPLWRTQRTCEERITCLQIGSACGRVNPSQSEHGPGTATIAFALFVTVGLLALGWLLIAKPRLLYFSRRSDRLREALDSAFRCTSRWAIGDPCLLWRAEPFDRSKRRTAKQGVQGTAKAPSRPRVRGKHEERAGATSTGFAQCFQ